jgi:NAD(P)H-hydrate epimerase
MERASQAFVHAFTHLYPLDTNLRIAIYCGPGNNGGDGLAIARMLHAAGYEVHVVRCQIGTNYSADHRTNWERLQSKRVIPAMELANGDSWDQLPAADLVIDALFGSGLNRPLSGYWEALVFHLNQLAVQRVAVDIPSGLFADQPLGSHTALRADHTISFQLPKLSFFAAEHATTLGQWQVVDIGLSEAGLAQAPTATHWARLTEVAQLLQERGRFDHKGTFGHALLIAGSFGKLGAAILSAQAILRSGAGLVTVHLPRCGYEVLQLAFPEAMVSVDKHRQVFSTPPPLSSFRAIGVGPGLGQDELTAKGLRELLETANVPLVLDADALNILAAHPEWLTLLPTESILTPHPGEFSRLFGPQADSFASWECLRSRAQTYGIYLLLKGGYTVLATPEGELYFFTVGNPGMATAGAGDVLTGILTGLLAQGYSSFAAASLGISLHGLAGDLAAEAEGQESLLAADIIGHLGRAFTTLKAYHKR